MMLRDVSFGDCSHELAGRVPGGPTLRQRIPGRARGRWPLRNLGGA